MAAYAFSDTLLERAGVGLDVARAHLENSAVEAYDKAEQRAFQKALLSSLCKYLHESVSPEVYLAFESVKLNGEAPAELAKRLGVSRSKIDKWIFHAKAMLKKIAQRTEFNE